MPLTNVFGKPKTIVIGNPSVTIDTVQSISFSKSRELTFERLGTANWESAYLMGDAAELKFTTADVTAVYTSLPVGTCASNVTATILSAQNACGSNVSNVELRINFSGAVVTNVAEISSTNTSGGPVTVEVTMKAVATGLGVAPTITVTSASI